MIGPVPAADDCTGTSWWNALTKRGRAEQPPTLVLVISPAPKGRFFGHIGDDLIVTSRQPFLDGARELLKRGHDPATPYNMRHANTDTLSFVTTTIGHAAELSVNDTRTTRFQKFEPFDWQP